MKRSLLLASFAALAAAACMDSPTAPEGAAPVLSVSAQAQGRYIVRFRDTEPDVRGETDRLVRAHRGRLDYTYHAAIRGFAGAFSSQEITALSRDPRVLSVEPDQIAHAIATQPNPPSWGLDRIDQQSLPLSASYTYNANGTGVTVYIIDTGIRFSHGEFGGRATTGVDEITIGGTAQDCNGHGTHVAGTVGGSSYGVAKNVSLVAVRVLDCAGSGTYAQVIAGVDWVTQRKQANPSTPMAANMSLGGPFSSALNAAVTNSINAGVTYALAAGNSGINACNESPSSTPSAITVAATAINDARPSFSNFGSCVDIFAPGVNIKSSWNGSDTDTTTISGTSMASPHVAGAAALYLELNPGATPAAIASALTTNATLNKVTNPGSGSPNRLLRTSFIGGAAPPVANFTFSCTGFACNFDASSSTAAPGATYAWGFGDDTGGSGVTVSHTYNRTGTFPVRVTVTDANGSNTKIRNVTVTASLPVPVANFTFTCTQLSCSFDASSSTAQTSATYGWSWGDGTPNGSGKTPTHAYAAPGAFNVTLTVTDGGGSNSRTQTVNPAAPPPVASFTLTCTQLSCSFDANGSTAQANATYGWSWGDGSPNGSGKTATHAYGSPGSFTVTLTVTDAGGTSSTTRTANPTLPAPVANFTFTCNQLSCSFDASSSTAQTNATYDWAWGDGSPNGSGKTTTHAFASAGTYSVTLTVTDAGGTSGTTQSVNTAVAVPVANFTFTCTQASCSFDGSSSTAQSGATFSWAWGDGSPNGSGTTASHVYATQGTFNVTLTVTDAGGSNSRTRAVTVTAPKAVVNFTFSCVGRTCSFDGSATIAQPNATYTFYFGDDTSAPGKTATHTYNRGATFPVALVVVDAGGQVVKVRQVTVP